MRSEHGNEQHTDRWESMGWVGVVCTSAKSRGEEGMRAWLQRDEEAGEGQSLSVIQLFICLTQQILSVPHSRCWVRPSLWTDRASVPWRLQREADEHGDDGRFWDVSHEEKKLGSMTVAEGGLRGSAGGASLSDATARGTQPEGRALRAHREAGARAVSRNRKEPV